MMGVDYFSNANISDFEQVMYLPLYWFGRWKPVLNEKLSIAMLPVFSDSKYCSADAATPGRMVSQSPLVRSSGRTS